MTKAALVAAMAAKSRLTKKHTELFIEDLFARIAGVVRSHGRFHYPGFGTWTIRSRKARRIRNPQTNDLMDLPKSKTVGFRPAKELKASL